MEIQAILWGNCFSVHVSIVVLRLFGLTSSLYLISLLADPFLKCGNVTPMRISWHIDLPSPLSTSLPRFEMWKCNAQTALWLVRIDHGRHRRSIPTKPSDVGSTHLRSQITNVRGWRLIQDHLGQNFAGPRTQCDSPKRMSRPDKHTPDLWDRADERFPMRGHGSET